MITQHTGGRRQAAQKVQVSEATGYRWARRPEIRIYLEDVRSEVLQCAAGKIFTVTGKAMTALDNLLESENEQVR